MANVVNAVRAIEGEYIFPEYLVESELRESELHASRHALALSEVWNLYYGED